MLENFLKIILIFVAHSAVQSRNDASFKLLQFFKKYLCTLYYAGEI